MKITRKQIRQIIKEYAQRPIPEGEPVFGQDGIHLPHPLFKGNYAGNGIITNVFEQGREWLEANRDKSEYFSLALDILDEKISEDPQGHTLHYFPFIFGEDLIGEMEKHQAPADIVDGISWQSQATDSEYNAPDW